MKDYYQILGVSKTATQEEIKRAYYKLAHQYHPDKGGDKEKMKEINEAYQILSDKEKRSQYDRFGATAENPGWEGFNWSWANNPKPSGFDFDFDDIEDIFGNVFGFGGKSAQRKNRKGGNIRIDFEISLEQALKNVVKEIKLSKYVVCERCQGKGAEPGTAVNECRTCRGTGEVQEIKRTFLGSFTNWTVCPDCHGEGQKPEKPCIVCKGDGRIRGEEDVKINIPAGVDNNQILKVAEKGDAGKRSAKAGDLFVRIFISKHPIFERRGDDLFASLPITYSQAVLGGEVEIDSLDGKKIILKVPAGSESGKIFKISGRGIPHFSGFGRGNLYLRLVLETPKKLTKDQKELLRKLREAGL